MFSLYVFVMTVFILVAIAILVGTILVAYITVKAESDYQSKVCDAGYDDDNRKL